MNKSQNDNTINSQYSSLLTSLKNQIDKLELLIQNVPNYKIYKNSIIINLFKTKPETIRDYILEIQEHYQSILDITNQDLKKHKIIKLGEQIEALLKLIRVLKIKQAKYYKTQKKDNTPAASNKNQLRLQSLENRKTWLTSILQKIEKAILEKQHLFNTTKSENNIENLEILKKQILELHNKKIKTEKELFSIIEQL